MDPSKVSELKGFVTLLKQKPELLHAPPLAFFKDYLLSMGATVPSASTGAAQADSPKTEAKTADFPPRAPEPQKVDPEPVVEEESEEEPEIEEYDPEAEGPDDQKMEEESEEAPVLGPEGEIELTDEQMDKQGDLKQQAQEAIEDGDKAKAITLLTEAFAIGNVSAMMYAKRADILLKSKRPVAAIKDADAALAVNPDSAKANKIKGLACRYLHKWDDAHTHISKAQQLDFDDGLEEAQKFVDKRFKELEKVRVAKRVR